MLDAESHAWTAWPRLAPAWAGLARGRSMFLRAESVTAWLDTFGPALQPTILLLREPGGTGDGAVVGACILVRRRRFGITQVYLNTAGEDVQHSACLEFNELVCRPGREAEVAQALRRHLGHWDRLHVAWIADEASRRALEDSFGPPDVLAHSVSHYVDLRSIRSLDELLDGPARNQLRRSQRRYAALGPLVLDEARTLDEARAFLAALAELHQRTWRARGERGSFASPVFRAYHERLLEHGFALGRIQLLRLRAGDTPVGYQYNFVNDGKVWFYQCGYDYGLVARSRPGTVMHALAIQHAIDAGHAEYDFMAGGSEHKRRMGNASRPVASLTWHRRSLKMTTFDLLKRAQRAIVRRWHEPPVGVVLTDLFAHRASDPPPEPLPPDPSLRIGPMTTDQVLATASLQQLDPDEVAQRLARGDCCYGAWQGDQLAHFLWVQRQGPHHAARCAWDFTVAPGEFWIFHGYTAPGFRGRHLMARTVECITADLFGAGCHTARAYISRTNTPSQRGAVRAGFAKTGTKRALRVGGRYWALKD